MARKTGKVRRDGDMIWLDIGLAASLLGTTRRKLIERAIAGEFRFEEDKFGMPARVAEPDVAPLRAARLAAVRAKPPRKPRPKTPEQQEAEWARIAANNARQARDGMFMKHHLRLTLPHPKKDKPE